MSKPLIRYEDILHDLMDIGVQKGDLINVKASLKSIGIVNGGAKTLLDALLSAVGDEGTIVTESFVEMYSKKRDAKNNVVTQNTVSYAGALANEILRHPKVYRSTHPVQKFAAIGSKAKELMGHHTPDSRPYDVLREMIFHGGKNIRIGGLDKVVGVGTTHVALDYMKIAQKRDPLSVFYYQDGELRAFKVNWANGCKKVFNNLIPLFFKKNAILNKGKIGIAEALLTDMKTTYDIEIELLTNNLKSFKCDDPACINCNLGWKHTQKKPFRTIWALMMKKKFGLAYCAFIMIFNRNFQPR